MPGTWLHLAGQLISASMNNSPDASPSTALALTNPKAVSQTAAPHAVAPPGAPNTVYSEQEVIQVLLTFLDGLAANVMSGDVWILAEYAARAQLVDSGLITEEKFNAIAERIQSHRRHRGKSNPLHSMF